ncbi:MAG: NADH-dependent [FeFe] hydrogenase, group A6, partial [Acetanaerobacterium sp.]
CRICVVEVKGARSLVASCVYPVNEGMEVTTNSQRVAKSRRQTLELILSTHNKSCLSCVRSGSCELQKLCNDYGVENEYRYTGENITYPIDRSAAHMFRDNSKCILCRRCVAACDKVQSVSVIGPNDRGFKTHIGCSFENDLADVACVSCGQCIVACPTGALSENDQTDIVWNALADPTKHVIVQPAPSVRVTLGESFGMPVGSNVKGKMVAALRRIGFDGVFDTDFSADVTIMEEATEFLQRFTSGGKLPLITSCSPGWIKFCEHNFPDFLDNLSSCKSPQQMFGAIAKTYYAKKMGLDPKDIFVVSVMPCTAKKFEAGRDNQSAAGNGIPDVDVALTTREFARMVKRAGLNFTALPDEEFDAPLGASTGAAVIFGATGGVMEAALRTANDVLTGKDNEEIEFAAVRGTEGIKEATYNIAGNEIRVAAVSGLANARKLLDDIRAGKRDYHFIEVMACPGGCVNGGGQPTQPASVRNFVDLAGKRAAAIYDEDRSLAVRKSHKNPAVQEVYKDFFGEPGSHLAHEVLHTTYTARSKY